MNRLFNSLTLAQCEAVRHIDGPLLILAGPGSGKTRVVTHRIAHMLESGISARSILALTFTNKAADEMRNRVADLAPGEPVWMSTFHRFCARLLRNYAPLAGLQENYTIYDSGDSRKVLQRTLRELDLDALHFTPEQIASKISWYKNRLVTAEEFEPKPGNPVDKIVADVYPVYQQRLLSSAAVDFDDLLLHVARLLRENPEVRQELDARYRYILVDEYQDTNLVQYAIVRALSIDQPNVAVTGDPDQAIYGWRGANLENILKFESDFPGTTVVRLEQNYRSTKHILQAADELIKYNLRRKQKSLFTENDLGQPVRFAAYRTQTVEAEAIAARIAEAIRTGNRRPRDFAIFYRVNALSRALEFAMRDQGIPYQVVSGLEFYQRKEIKDILAYLQLINNPRDDVAFLRIVNSPPRGIGRTTLERISEHAARYRLPLLEASRECGLIESIAKRTATKVVQFVAMIDRFRERAHGSVEEILRQVLDESGYRRFLTETESEEDEERLANIEELITAASQFDQRNPDSGQLEAFLEQSSLVNDTDVWEESDKVTLMTLHAAKGLEFPVVFIIAVEHGLLPHERSLSDPDQMEEERRLLFVGITRAQQELQLSIANHREFRGRSGRTIPSNFLMELPRQEMEMLYGLELELEPVEGEEGGVEEIHWDEMWLEPEVPSATSSKTETPSTLPLRALQTAADMLQEVEVSEPATPPVAPELYREGMGVVHPSYGLGKVIQLTGTGSKRTATVAFVTSGQRKFVIAASPLRPAPGSFAAR